MLHAVRFVVLGAVVPLLGGCIARSAVGIVTAPVKAVSKGVDLATTSQSEADEKRGRELRRREERLGQLERSHAKEDRRCEGGDAEACQRRDAIGREIDLLLPQVPAEPR